MTAPVTWTAVLAPIGHPSPDGRILAAGHRWTLRAASPLLLPRGHDVVVVGAVTEIVVSETELRASGVVMDSTGEVAARMAANVLRPEMDVAEGVVRAEGDTMVFCGGTIGWVTLGGNPAFPEARFEAVGASDGGR